MGHGPHPATGQVAFGQDGGMPKGDHDLGLVFDEVPALYDRVRPAYPEELFSDLVALTGLNKKSTVLEVGIGTGQATRSLAGHAGTVTAIEPGPGMVTVARQRLAPYDNVEIEMATFEEWDDQGRRFDVVVASSSWHWVDPSIRWPKAHRVLRPEGWMAVLGHVVVRRPGESEVYSVTADLHERFAPGSPDWGDPPLEEEVLANDRGWGSMTEPGALFGAPVVRWYPAVQWLDGRDFADLLRTHSIYRKLGPAVREPLLGAIAERIRTRMGDRAPRRYLTVLRAAPSAAEEFVGRVGEGETSVP